MLTGSETVQKGGFGPKCGFFPKHWLTAKVYVKKCFSGLLSSGKQNNFLHSEALTLSKWVKFLFCTSQATPTVTVTLTLTSPRTRKGEKKNVVGFPSL